MPDLAWNLLYPTFCICIHIIIILDNAEAEMNIL